MESFQDGGQQNIKSEHNEYPPPIEGSHMNPDMNNFSQSSGEGSIGPENFSKMSEGMHSSQMQNYPGYNRGNYGMSDQHGGIMSGSVEYNSPNSQFSGQFSQSPLRPSYPGMHKPGMSPVRPGMVPPGMGMIPGSYSSSQRMMTSQAMSQSGPTPTLNQLLQTPNSGQRFPGSYGDFSGAQSKGGEMGSGSSYPMPQQGWNGSPRSMSYPQGSMPGTPYRSQASSMSESRRPSGMSPGPGPGQGYPHQGQYMGPSMAPNAQRYMMGQGRPAQMPPMSSHGYNQQMPPHSQMNYSPSMPNQTSQPSSQQQQQQQQQMYHGQPQQPQPPGQPPPQASPTPTQQQSSLSLSSSAHRSSSSSSQGASPKQASPAPPGMADQNSNHSTSSKKSEEVTESNRENSHGEETNGESSHGETQGGSQPHLGVGPLRPAPSPAGSTGSRSDTPASNSGAQVGSPMPPRPPSSQLEGQSHTSHSPMATQGYNQAMMPPPMPGQMGYPGGSSGKMGGPAGMVGGQVPPHYPQYNSQYPQAGTFGRQQGMGSMQGNGGPGSMPGASYPQSMYNGPGSSMGQMGPGGPGMYNNMMSRGMQNYSTPYGPGGPGMPMGGQYGSFNSHMGPGQGPGPGPGPGSGPGPGQTGANPMVPNPMMPSQPGMNTMGQPGMMPQGGSMLPGGKGAQAAAQAALMAAANSAGARMPGRGMAGSPRMMGPGSPSPGMMNHSGNLGNPSLNSMSNQIQQITSSSITLPGKPASPAVNASHSASGTPNPPDSAPPNVNGAPGGADTASLMSPMSGSDTQDTSSRPSSTATPGQTADTASGPADNVGSDGSGSMPSSDSTSVDSGFHSAADQSEKPPSESLPMPPHPSPSNSHMQAPNGPCEDPASRDGDRLGRGRGDSAVSAAASASAQTSNTTTAVTSASMGTAVTQSITTPVTSETESSGSQTSMPMMMSSSNNNATQNGPHFPHPHPNYPPHPGMGYPMGPHGPGPMPNSHMMPGMHHPGMHNNMPGGGMQPYNMPHGGSMPNNMPPGSMANSMQQGGMPNNMPPGGMPNNLPPGSMPNNMPPGNMPPGSMSNNMPPGSMPPGGMMNSMPHGSMPNNMPPGTMPGSMPGSMPNHMPGGNMPPRSMSNSSMGPMNMPPQNNCAPPMPSEEPPEKKKKKASDVTKLYDMGSEMDRRPFLDKLLGFLEEKGTPLTTMPCISKQPLDLYRLYYCVREKGGMLEVNRGKKWKEICAVVNIGSSASAAFTLKKNYIRYLFGFECKYERGGLDPTPILAEMEAQMEKKRENKKRVPSPGSQSSQDAFQQAPNSNSQMMDGYPGPGGPGMPPPYIQGPDGQMVPNPMGGGMMMPNSMMPQHPGMMGAQPGMHPSNMGGSGPGMMGHGHGSMMMGQGGMMNSGMGPGMMGGPMHMGPGGYSAGPGMMGQGPPSNSSSMGPSPGPPSGGSVPGRSTPTTVSSSASSSLPPTSSSIPLPPSSTPNSRPPTADSVSVQDPFSDEPSKSSSPATFQRGGPPGPSPSPGGFPSPGPPTSRPSSASNPATPSFPNGPATSEQGPGFRRPPEGFQSGAPGSFPFGHDSSGQQFRPSGGSDPSFAPRFPGQQPPFRPPGSGDSFNGSQSFSSHGPGFGPRMPGQEGFGSYPSPQRPPMGREGSFSSGPGREGGPWSPMHAQRNYLPPTAPATPPMGPYARPQQRASPQTRDKILSSKLQQKAGGMVPNTPFGPKKEIVFPPDSVEAVTPTLNKRRRLTHKDLGQIDAWRLMMALKSGLLAESTWALDTLNILLFDDATIAYFNLLHLPGLLEVLTEHFRASLAHIFRVLRPKEVQGKPSPSALFRSCLHKRGEIEDEEESVEALLRKPSEARLDKQLYGCDFTMTSRQGKAVKVEEDSEDRAVLDGKSWDHFCHFTSGVKHWQKGGGDLTNHVVPCFESSNTHRFLSDMFCPRATREKERREAGKKRKAAEEREGDGDGVLNGGVSGSSGGAVRSPCSKQCKVEVQDSSKEDPISLKGAASSPHDHSQVHRNNIVKKVEIKQEPQDMEEDQRQSSETPPPPVLPDATQDGKVLNENGVKEENGSDSKEDMEVDEKPTPPDLTREGGECEEVNPEKDHTKTVVNSETKESAKTDTDTVLDDREPEDEDAMTAEIVAMMTREHDSEVEEEAYRHDEPPLTTIQADQEEAGRRCVAISNILRSLSCIPGNEALLSKHSGLMLVLGQVLMLHHWHPPRSKAQPATPLPKEEKEEEKGEGKTDIDQKEDKNTDKIEAEGEKKDESEKSETKDESEKAETKTGDSEKSEEKKNEESKDSSEESSNKKEEAVSETVKSDMQEKEVKSENKKDAEEEVKVSETRESKKEKETAEIPRESKKEEEVAEIPMPVLPEPPQEDLEDKDWATSPEWWWETLESVRENTLVVLANICSHMHMGDMESEVCLPVLDGLLHWMVCPSSAACDPLPTASPSSQLSLQRLVLEALCKLCIHDENVDLLLATPPFSRIVHLMSRLMRLLSERAQPVPREFSIVLLSRLVQGDPVAARAMALQHPAISLLIEFLESAEQSAMAVASQQGYAALHNNPEVMGTSLDMLRRAASTLLHMARVPENRKLFLHHQTRLLTLVMSQILDTEVTQIISDVLFECSQAPMPTT